MNRYPLFASTLLPIYNLGAQAIRPCRSTLPALINCLSGSLYLRSTSTLTGAADTFVNKLCMLCIQDSAARSSWSQTHSPRNRFVAMLYELYDALRTGIRTGIRTGQVMDCYGDRILLWHDGSALSVYPVTSFQVSQNL